VNIRNLGDAERRLAQTIRDSHRNSDRKHGCNGTTGQRRADDRRQRPVRGRLGHEIIGECADDAGRHHDQHNHREREAA